MEQILSLSDYLKKRFGTKIYKISLNGGMTCPNRDGHAGFGGCIFCSEGGSGDFAASFSPDIWKQIETGKSQTRGKLRSGKYIAYFQSYTNTYAPVDTLRSLFVPALSHPDIVALSIATRPDCLPDDVLTLLAELNVKKPVFVELGFQTSNESTARFINRGYENSCFDLAVTNLEKAGIETVVHTIIGLPGETDDDILATIRYLNHLPIHGIKLQLMHILKRTELAKIYAESPEQFHYLELADYIRILGEALELLRPDIVIHRLTGDGPKSLLIAPEWSANKKMVLNAIHQYLSTNNIIQGRKYRPHGT